MGPTWKWVGDGRLGLSLLLLTCAAALAAALAPAHALDQPPLDCSPAPATYPAPDAPPVVQTWGPRALPREWRPPACAGWDDLTPTIVVAVSGSLVAPGGVEALATRFGAISTLRGLQYWSTMDDRWETLIVGAEALDGPHGTPRGDFSAAELVPGRDLFFRERDNRSSAPVTYRMRVLERSPDRLAVAITNVAPVKKLLVTYFASGELRANHILTHLPDGRWGYFSLSGAHASGVAALGNAEASYASRALAMFRHVPTAN